MPISWKEGTVLCMCGLVVWGANHKGGECPHGQSDGYWCKQMPVHLPDLPHQHYWTTPASTAQMLMDTGSMSS
jgi:hypothetical protein